MSRNWLSLEEQGGRFAKVLLVFTTPGLELEPAKYYSGEG